MLHIGCHLSVAKGFAHMGRTALSIDADTFQFFTRNPQGGKAKELDIEDIRLYNDFSRKHHFAAIVAHAPYTLNPCSDNPEIREFAEMIFADDLRRMELLPYNYYNFHPGSHVGQGCGKGISLIIDLLNRTLTPKQTTTVLLETMSGKGSEIGSRFEELFAIISGVEQQDKLGVCFDTCHAFAAGYDIVNNLDAVLDEFDKIIGLKRLRAIHLNDSLMPFASHKDRHAKIGAGYIGKDALLRFIHHPAVKDLPIILETPNDLDGYAAEISLLRQASE